MSKDWIGYHNFNNLKKNYRDLAESVLYTNASGNPRSGDKMWVIESIGNKSPKLMRLVDCFVVDRVDSNIPSEYKGMTKRVVAKRSFMVSKWPVNINELKGECILEPLKTYVLNSPGMTGAENMLPALERLLDMALERS